MHLTAVVSDKKVQNRPTLIIKNKKKIRVGVGWSARQAKRGITPNLHPLFRMLLARSDVQVNLKGKDGVTALGISFKH